MKVKERKKNNRKQTKGRNYRYVYDAALKLHKWIRLETKGTYRLITDIVKNNRKHVDAEPKRYVNIMNGDKDTAICTTKSLYTRERLGIE